MSLQVLKRLNNVEKNASFLVFGLTDEPCWWWWCDIYKVKSSAGRAEKMQGWSNNDVTDSREVEVVSAVYPFSVLDQTQLSISNVLFVSAYWVQVILFPSICTLRVLTWTRLSTDINVRFSTLVCHTINHAHQN